VSGGSAATASAGPAEAVRLIQHLYANLAYNPNELLQLQALFVRLGRLPAQVG
jgi:hypothetical protein